MRKLILVAIFLATCPFCLNAQNCPSSSFNIPDTLCAGTVIPLANTSTGGSPPLTYSWDFCPGDLTQNPLYDTIGDFGVLAIYTDGIDLVFENGNWYGFALDGANYSLTRFDFQGSLKNMPTAVNVGGIGGGAYLDDIQMAYDGTNWYAFVCTFQNNLVRVDFGPSLTNPAPTWIYLPIPVGFLVNPFVMKLVKDHNDYKILVANTGNGTVTLVNFGTSLANPSPTLSNLPGTFPNLLSITAVRDCDRWYGFPLSTGGNLSLVDFGDSITSTPVSVNTTNPQPAIGVANEIEVLNDKGNWYGLIMGDVLKRIDFGSTVNNLSPPTFPLAVNFSTPEEHKFSVKKTDEGWIGITTYTAGDSKPDLRRFVFPNDCSSAIPSSSDTNPAGVMYSSPGMHYVTLQATDTNGNNNFYLDSIYINPAAEADFSHSAACAGSLVSFYDSSIINGGTISGWHWDFGDSSTSTAINPSHIYSTPGDYLVTLQVTANNICVSSYTDTVTVGVLPVAGLSFTDSLCADDLIQFNDVSTSIDPIVTWEWNFGDSISSGVNNPLHSYQAGGTYYVNLTVTTDNGCAAIEYDSIYIWNKPAPDFVVANTCIGEAASFLNLSTITDSSSMSYSWDFGDLTTSNQPNPSHPYIATVAIYNVQLISTSINGCADSITKPVRIGNKPVPAFTMNPATICKGNNISFTDQSSVPGGDPGDTINTWLWTFGDTITSALQNPIHVYADTGTFTVTLTVNSPTSCDSAVSQTVTVIDAPVAAFNYTDVCLGGANNFIDFSTSPPGSVIISRDWDFGDSTTASGTNVNHTYAIAGTYQVVLTVTDTFGCTDFVMHQVTAHPLPLAAFSNGVACTGTPLLFTNQSSIAAGDTITGNSWTFGDGGVSSLVNPSHSYLSFGQNQVTLIVNSSYGCYDTISHQVFVNQSPIPDFTYSHTCLGEPTSFNYLANPFPSTINSYNWSFGDLTSETDENPIHTYATPTTYNVSVTVTDNAGCTAMVSHPVIVNPVPLADFGFTNGCAGYPASFYDSSSVISGLISSYLWNFGNGNNDTVQSPSFQFDTAGTYPVSLLVITVQGCSDSVSKPVTVSNVPVASFTQNAVVSTPPLTVIFTNTSTGATLYLWDFGNGSTDTAKNPVHLFADTGTYIISLVAYNPEGCSDTAYSSLIVLIPYVDLAVLNVTTVRQNNLLSISADLFNLGNIVVNNFDLIAQMEGGTILHESYANPFNPGLLKYTFHAKLETNQYTNPGYICVEAKNPNGLSGDAASSNDKMCTGNGNSFEIIDIYNDPYSGQATIHINIPTAEDVTIDVFDISGKKISDKVNFRGTAGLNTYIYDTRTLSKGAYSCTVTYRDETKTKRLLKF